MRKKSVSSFSVNNMINEYLFEKWFTRKYKSKEDRYYYGYGIKRKTWSAYKYLIRYISRLKIR